MRRASIVGLLAAACGSSHSSGTLANKGGGDAPNTSDVLAFLPIDSDIVIGFDVQQMVSSGLWREYGPRLEGEMRKQMRAASADCKDVDVTKIERVTMAVQSAENGKMKIVGVTRSPQADRLLSCMEHGAKAQVTRDRDVVVIQNSGETMAAKLVGDKTLVIEVGADAGAASLGAIVSAGAPLRNSPAFIGVYGKLQKGASMWGVVNGNSSLMRQAAGMLGIHPRAAFGTLTVSDGVAGNAHISFASADEAQNLASTMKAQAQMVASNVSKLDISASGDEVVIDAAISAQQIQSLARNMGGFGAAPPPVQPPAP